MHLLTTDWHLDDNPDNDYRWKVFDHIHALLDAYGDRISAVFNLGDTLDRKDRYSGTLVNRFLAGVASVGKRVPFTILQGNHDRTLDGSAFFSFVNGAAPVKGVRYITEPTQDGRLILLPFTPTPSETWSVIDFRRFRAAFMHVTPYGAVGENGYKLVGNKLPEFPESLKIYTGDVHVPQTIGQFTVVGCPHSVKFGDKFPPRMLLIDERSFEIVEEVPITTVSKRVIEVGSVEELRDVVVRPGDQVRIRYRLASGAIDGWGQVESQIAAWAKAAGVTIAGVEVDVGSTGSSAGARRTDAAILPDVLLREFAAAEGVTEDMLKVGLELLVEHT